MKTFVLLLSLGFIFGCTQKNRVPSLAVDNGQFNSFDSGISESGYFAGNPNLYACADFSGLYCHPHSGRLHGFRRHHDRRHNRSFASRSCQRINMSQSNRRGWSLRNKRTVIPIDGLAHDASSEGMPFKMTAICHDSSILINLYGNGVNVQESYTLENNGRILHIVRAGTFRSNAVQEDYRLDRTD